eukprot:TRINITY_DN81870_c0_g1_i1.p1 TRINITY_DN81870_c0_g1~~TRINITY_DN81870_c0_g1_i1.p1  ORF type:complete len:492 (+),score=84.71 TRINITY_DN81870_c0_g1_i1:87-1562(+)
MQAPAQSFRHYAPEQPSFFGIQLPQGRAASTLSVVTDEDVTRYLRDDPEGPFRDVRQDLLANRGSELSEHWRAWGFEVDDSEPLLKANWHGVHAWGDPAPVYGPRSNTVVPHMQAPPRIVAFLDAFRGLNEGVWQNVREKLLELKTSDGQGGRPGHPGLHDCIDAVLHSLQADGHFASLEAQVWGGGDLTMKSHLDGGTGLMHLAITLGGERLFRMAKFRERHSPQPDKQMQAGRERRRDETSVWVHGNYEEDHIWDLSLDAGHGYLCSSFCFEHGVKYLSGSDDPVVVLQCRFGFLNETEANFVNGNRNGDMRQVVGAISEALHESIDGGALKMPSLEDVKSSEERLGLVQPAVAGSNDVAGADASDAQSASPVLAGVDISRMKVPDLKRELRALGLDDSGLKSELKARLAAHSGREVPSRGEASQVSRRAVGESLSAHSLTAASPSLPGALLCGLLLVSRCRTLLRRQASGSSGMARLKWVPRPRRTLN